VTQIIPLGRKRVSRPVLVPFSPRYRRFASARRGILLTSLGLKGRSTIDAPVLRLWSLYCTVGMSRQCPSRCFTQGVDPGLLYRADATAVVMCYVQGARLCKTKKKEKKQSCRSIRFYPTSKQERDGIRCMHDLRDHRRKRLGKGGEKYSCIKQRKSVRRW
jgi:hypothetical protein